MQADESVVEFMFQLRMSEIVGPEFFYHAGSFAYSKNNITAARRLFETSSKIDRHPKSFNNLAWISATKEPRNLDLAIQLIERAVEIEPLPEIIKTRGEIRFKRSEWADAIEDFLVAINALPNDPDLQTKLSTAYAEIGNTELSRVHLRASELEK